MERLDRETSHQWHVALNALPVESFDIFNHWPYEAKHMADEIPRLIMLFAQERIGKLPEVHRKCSLSLPETLADNHLTCCLGVECRKCPVLAGVGKANLPPEKIDEIKAWTCAAHIVSESGKKFVDTSEGHVLHEGDKVFWQNVYDSLTAVANQ